MTNPVPYKVLGNVLVNSEANASWTTLKPVTEISETPEWKKSRWCVNQAYDWLIIEAVDNGYERYEELPEDMQFRLAMEIIKAEKGSVFADFDKDSLLADCIIEIMLTKGSLESFNQLYEILQAHFIRGYGNKPACFASTINNSLEDQLRIKAVQDEALVLYGDPDDDFSEYE